MQFQIDFTNIMAYSEPAAIISDYMPEALEGLDDDILLAIDHLVDFEPVRFYVINDSHVLVSDSINGDIIGAPVPLEEFTAATIESARELA